MEYVVYQREGMFMDTKRVAKGEVPAETVSQALDQVFMMGNDPDSRMSLLHSISVGDIVVINSDEVEFSQIFVCQSKGWLEL